MNECMYITCSLVCESNHLELLDQLHFALAVINTFDIINAHNQNSNQLSMSSIISLDKLLLKFESLLFTASQKDAELLKQLRTPIYFEPIFLSAIKEAM